MISLTELLDFVDFGNRAVQNDQVFGLGLEKHQLERHLIDPAFVRQVADLAANEDFRLRCAVVEG